MECPTWQHAPPGARRPPGARPAPDRGRRVPGVDICGIATDHCVRATALAAVHGWFAARVLLDLTAGVAEATTRAALAELAAARVRTERAPWVGDGPLVP